MIYLILSIAFFLFGFSMLVAQAIFGFKPVHDFAYLAMQMINSSLALSLFLIWYDKENYR